MLKPENPIFEGFIAIRSLRNFYIPILRLDKERLKKQKLDLYIHFENLRSITNFETLTANSAGDFFFQNILNFFSCF